MSNLKRIPVGAAVRGWPSETWDTICTAVEQLPQFTGSGRAARSKSPTTEPHHAVWMQNDTAAEVARGNVLGIDTIVQDLTISGNVDTITSQRPALSCIEPEVLLHTQKLVVPLQHIEAGGQGWAAIGGLTWVLVDVTDADHTHARIDNGEVLLVSGTYGAPIVVKQSGTGTKWALVNLAGYIPQTRWCLTSEEIPAGTGSPDVTPGTGDGELYAYDATGDLVLTGETIVIHNAFSNPIETDTKIKVIPSALEWRWGPVSVDCGV